MTVKPDGAPPSSEAAAHRRWLVTIAITILFGTFGAVMTYLSYAKSSTKPSRSSSDAPAAAPTEPRTEAPSAEAPREGDDKPDKGKDKDK
jgi:hypothetical protein